jgi:predicted RNA-binding Zn-ribbon protein involved in translation (DUF1610 family)
MVEDELLAPCGLYCGVCGIYLAHREGNHKFKERLAQFYQRTPEEMACRGCLSEERYVYCRTCAVRDCATEKGLQGCHQCQDFPCDLVRGLRPIAQRVVLRTIPAWRELGTEKFVEEEKARYQCPHCGYQLFRGAKRCRICRQPVDLD